MSAEKLELARQAVTAFNSRDVDWMVAHATPDVEWYPAIAGGVEVEPFRGHEGVRAFFKDLGEVWEEFELQPEEIRDLGEAYLVLSQVRARGKTGVRLEQSLDGLWELRNGKFVRGRSYLSREEALQAAGEIAGHEVSL